MEEEHVETSFEAFQFIDDEIQRLISVDPLRETANSFTALLDLPPNQAEQLLHSPETITEILPHSSVNNWNPVKREPIEAGYPHNSSPIAKSKEKSTKRNNTQKVRLSAKKMKDAAKESEGEYIHVRARRGEATDSHSLAERARREKINTRMQLLKELVPGCNKVSGTAMVLEKIINHVQSLQLQVEFLSMKLAAVQPDIDIILLDNLFSSECGSPMESNFASMVSPSSWVDKPM